MPLYKDISHMTDDEIANQSLIDCYLTDQISEHQWQQHLAETPGLHRAWMHRVYGPYGPSRPVGKSPALSAPYGSARERRRNLRETIVARGLLGITIAFGIGSLFAEHPRVVVLAACASFVSFIAVCFVAGNRQYRKEGSIPRRGEAR